MNYLFHLSDSKLRQFRKIIETRWRRVSRVDLPHLKTLYTLVCFEVMRRKEASRPAPRKAYAKMV